MNHLIGGKVSFWIDWLQKLSCEGNDARLKKSRVIVPSVAATVGDLSHSSCSGWSWSELSDRPLYISLFVYREASAIACRRRCFTLNFNLTEYNQIYIFGGIYGFSRYNYDQPINIDLKPHKCICCWDYVHRTRNWKAYLNIDRFVAAELGCESKSVADCARRTLRFRFFRLDDLDTFIPTNTQNTQFSPVHQSIPNGTFREREKTKCLGLMVYKQKNMEQHVKNSRGEWTMQVNS